ncbi:right-handed parallel beta-helix repeat-containing protein [Acidobacteria bacterium AH-259-O06]|nr:right-handed parallel beta-helix repeat-containing protein [Acidobacteria bacterium AH-259-O06]
MPFRIFGLRIVFLVALVASQAVLLAQGATFTVNSTADGGDSNPENGVCDDGTGNCTLRAAIEEANAKGGKDTIAFNIPGAGPHTIQPASALPTITDPVIIDGTTEPGASPNTNGPGLGSDALLKIELDGSAGAAANGLRITAGSSTVRGLVLNRFGGSGIVLESSGGNIIEGNYIGTDTTGTVKVFPFNSATGVSIVGSSNNTIGGTSAGARNVISGQFRGISIRGSVTGTLVQGNLIGTDATGTIALTLGNTNGIRIDGASNITIGGTVGGARNVISGNGFGIVILGGTTTGILVQGNFIGTDVTGTAALGNSSDGILAGTGTTIGGTAAGAGNVISGNNGSGVSISSGNLVQGNFIGTDVTGTADLGNSSDGVGAGSDNTIGGTLAEARNVISGNNGNGVSISSGNLNLVEGNFIGTDVTGTADLGNSSNGVRILLGSNNTIGGTTVEARNVISGNNSDGIQILGGSGLGNQVQGNFIGTDITGTAALGNSRDGVRIDGAPSNTIGGTTVGAGNVISSNNGAGVAILSSGATGNQVQGNFIGTQADGTNPLGNTSHGVFITVSVDNNIIGGTANDAGNTIAFNRGDGVFVRSGTGNAILSNSIFSNAGLGIDLGDPVDLRPDGVTNNDAGDGDTGPNNLQNFPVLTSATADTSIIEGTLNSTPNTTFTLDFFSSSACDSSGFGEGEALLGSTMVTTNGSGKTTFTVAFPDTVAAGQFITATATDPNENTSEFSQCVEAQVKLYFAQFGNSQGFSSDTVLTNPSVTKTVSGKVDFLDDNGLPLLVGIVAAGNDGAPLATGVLASEVKSSVDFAIPPLGALTISTDGQGDVAVGSAVVTSDSTLGGLIRFSISGIGIAGVGASQPLSGFITPVRRKSRGINTGIAIHNTEGQAVTLTLTLRNSRGEEVANGTKTIQNFPGRGHVAQFIDQLFPNADTDDFEGTLVVRVVETDGKVAATALELGPEAGQFTTLPVTRLN